ncbi:DUF4349 domain-containing protein [Metabacillus arenae]|uniref:DUF4349 domain-containing protein n=1 Tax=Metabacillus arenae TaxID=2771434 RepID=UPI001CD11449|nr:DUF4349 domain-containing protein [Metabacillus arenae]
MKKIWILSITLLFLFLTACSGNETESTDQSNMASKGEMESKSMEIADKEGSSGSNATAAESQSESPQEDKASQVPQVSERKVIYNASLHISVENYLQSLEIIQKEAEQLGGYIVNSNTYQSNENESREGSITVRVPQEKFNDFLSVVEKGSTKVNEKSISGQDVTEEFVDLESRMKSKKAVEARLLEFMKTAEKTEDLLKISSDLTAVQEEIEQLQGRMNYLENQSALATVTINLTEQNVNVPGLQGDELNTFEKTKKQFMDSLNFLLSFFSSIFVLLVGSLPILIPLAIVVLITIYFIKKSSKSKKTPPTDV